MQPEQSPYDFILNSQDPKKRPKFSQGDGSGSPVKRFIMVGGIGLVVLLFVIVGFGMLRGSGGSTTLLTVAQAQHETVRVADTIRNETTSQPVKNAAINTYFGVSSDKKSLATAFSTRGISFSEEQLALGQDADTDKLLENAKTAGTYDSTALEVLKSNITAYQTALQQAYGNVSNPEIKQALSKAFENAELLKKQLDSTQV